MTTELDSLETTLGHALRSDAAARPGDAELLRRLVDGALAPKPMPRIGLKVGIGIGVGAALILGAALSMRHEPAHAPRVEPATTIATTRVALAPDPSAPPVVATVEPAPIEIAAPRVQPAIPATDLYARANASRRKGADADAIADYRTLQRQWPSSPEALASHVSLGRLLLDKRSDLAGALGQFDQYLAGSSPGTLHEEALIGRARCLQQLGRADDERRAWQAVITTYPQSVYAEQARARIAALSK